MKHWLPLLHHLGSWKGETHSSSSPNFILKIVTFRGRSLPNTLNFCMIYLIIFITEKMAKMRGGLQGHVKCLRNLSLWLSCSACKFELTSSELKRGARRRFLQLVMMITNEEGGCIYSSLFTLLKSNLFIVQLKTGGISICFHSIGFTMGNMNKEKLKWNSNIKERVALLSTSRGHD